MTSFNQPNVTITAICQIPLLKALPEAQFDSDIMLSELLLLAGLRLQLMHGTFELEWEKCLQNFEDYTCSNVCLPFTGQFNLHLLCKDNTHPDLGSIVQN